MKCPLRFMGCEIDALKPPETRFICLKEECAWWETPLEVCCIRAQEATLGVILDQLVKLIDKMPKSTQFGR